MTTRLTPPHDLFDGWNIPALDLAAYRDRVDFHAPLRPDRETLFALCRAQVTHIPFENLDIVLGRELSLDADSLQRKLVQARRGGYCYEDNSLLAAVLAQAGFGVTGNLARVRMGSGQLRPTSHANLLVTLDDGTRWLADVGFGGHGLLEPLPLADGAEATQGGWRFRLDRVESDTWILSRATDEAWLDLYSFTTEARFPIDFAVANHFAATHPRSPFTARLLAQTTGEHERAALIDTELTILRPDEPAETRRLAPAELPEVLDHRFGITLTTPEAADLVRAVTAWRAG